jgi:hypothetical protein
VCNEDVQFLIATLFVEKIIRIFLLGSCGEEVRAVRIEAPYRRMCVKEGVNVVI